MEEGSIKIFSLFLRGFLSGGEGIRTHDLLRAKWIEQAKSQKNSTGKKKINDDM